MEGAWNVHPAGVARTTTFLYSRRKFSDKRVIGIERVATENRFGVRTKPDRFSTRTGWRKRTNGARVRATRRKWVFHKIERDYVRTSRTVRSGVFRRAIFTLTANRWREKEKNYYFRIKRVRATKRGSLVRTVVVENIGNTSRAQAAVVVPNAYLFIYGILTPWSCNDGRTMTLPKRLKSRKYPHYGERPFNCRRRNVVTVFEAGAHTTQRYI